MDNTTMLIAIIAGVFGCLFLGLIGVVMFIFCRRHRHKQKRHQEASMNPQNDHDSPIDAYRSIPVISTNNNGIYTLDSGSCEMLNNAVLATWKKERLKQDPFLPFVGEYSDKDTTSTSYQVMSDKQDANCIYPTDYNQLQNGYIRPNHSQSGQLNSHLQGNVNSCNDITGNRDSNRLSQLSAKSYLYYQPRDELLQESDDMHSTENIAISYRGDGEIPADKHGLHRSRGNIFTNGTLANIATINTSHVNYSHSSMNTINPRNTISDPNDPQFNLMAVNSKQMKSVQHYKAPTLHDMQSYEPYKHSSRNVTHNETQYRSQTMIKDMKDNTQHLSYNHSNIKPYQMLDRAQKPVFHDSRLQTKDFICNDDDPFLNPTPRMDAHSSYVHSDRQHIYNVPNLEINHGSLAHSKSSNIDSMKNMQSKETLYHVTPLIPPRVSSKTPQRPTTIWTTDQIYHGTLRGQKPPQYANVSTLNRPKVSALYNDTEVDYADISIRTRRPHSFHKTPHRTKTSNGNGHRLSAEVTDKEISKELVYATTGRIKGEGALAKFNTLPHKASKLAPEDVAELYTRPAKKQRAAKSRPAIQSMTYHQDFDQTIQTCHKAEYPQYALII